MVIWACFTATQITPVCQIILESNMRPFIPTAKGWPVMSHAKNNDPKESRESCVSTMLENLNEVKLHRKYEQAIPPLPPQQYETLIKT